MQAEEFRASLLKPAVESSAVAELGIREGMRSATRPLCLEPVPRQAGHQAWCVSKPSPSVRFGANAIGMGLAEAPWCLASWLYACIIL